jgi:enamine deaminase RidA (YjgF/YER057c/UK114 family)
MIERFMEEGSGYKIYIAILGENQAYITAAVSSHQRPVAELAADVYQHLFNILQNFKMQIVHERIFADLNFEEIIAGERARSFSEFGGQKDLPYTFIQGRPAVGEGLAGIQIRGFRPTLKGDGIWPVQHDGAPVGRKWRRNGVDFFMLQNIFGDTGIRDRYHQSCDMYDRAQAVLLEQGVSFKNVLRTWIYLSNILDWYSEFNRARNTRFTEFGLLGLSEKENTEAEHIYLPASTGILGENPAGAAATMDVLAVSPDSSGLSIAHTSGMQQKSPYRYGSAFSRAMTMKEKDVTHILLSGTASIDEHGKTVFLNDTAAQIQKTFEVVQALIRHEGASLSHIDEATVFFKSPQDFSLYQNIAEGFGVPDLPAIFLIADVCRDDLLFEIDAAIAF